ncbi:MAG: ABC transporter permease [Deltaproteobacteria bacterium]|nr:MAG: ABC transporter permease [Deltaproteobacteria bacterium]
MAEKELKIDEGDKPLSLNGGASKEAAVSVLPPSATVAKISLWKRILDIPLSVRLCLIIIIIMAFAAVFAPWVVPYDPNVTNIMERNAPPSLIKGERIGHLFGIDQLGRDILSRCVYGLRVSVGISLVCMVIGSLVGVTLGVISGLLGGWVDRIVAILVDFQLAVPYILMVLLGIIAFGFGIPVLVGLIGFIRWKTHTRLIRGQVLSIRESPFVEAARALGGSNFQIAIRHILPNIASMLIVLLTMNFPRILLLESSLSFLGIGVQPPTASLGRMVGEGRNYMASAWWIVIPPSGFIVLITLCMQIIGDWLRDVFDVRLER